jgi:hypothetical protein
MARIIRPRPASGKAILKSTEQWALLGDFSSYSGKTPEKPRKNPGKTIDAAPSFSYTYLLAGKK